MSQSKQTSPLIIFICLSLSLLPLSPLSLGQEQPRLNYSKETELIRRENELLALKKQVEEGPKNTQYLYEKIIPLVSEGKQEQAEKEIEDWYKIQRDFQDQTLQLMLDKQQFLMEESKAQVENLIGKLPQPYADQYSKFHQELILKHYSVWEKHKREVGTKDQRFRLYNFSDYFLGLRKMASKVQQKLNGKVPTDLKAKAPSFWEKTKAIPGLLFSITRIMRHSYWSLKRYFGGTPLTAAGAQLFKKLGNLFNYKVTVQGRENLPKEIEHNQLHKGKKDIYFFFPTHRSGVADVVLMGHLNLPHFMVFANPSTFMPGTRSSKILTETPEFIAVGPWRDDDRNLPSEKFIYNLKSGVASNIVNFASGFVSNASENLPFREELSTKLIAEAIKNGYNPTIIPISYEVSSIFLSQSGDADEKEIGAVIARPLPADFVKFLSKLESLKNGHKDLISTVVNAIWSSNIKKHTELSLVEMKRRVGLVLNGLKQKNSNSDSNSNSNADSPNSIISSVTPTVSDQDQGFDHDERFMDIPGGGCSNGFRYLAPHLFLEQELGEAAADFSGY